MSIKQLGRDVLNTVIGALIALAISWFYYVKASDDLIAETKRLRSLHNTTLAALQNLQNKNASFQLSRDEQGDFTKMSVEAKGAGTQATAQPAQ
ncbi:MAG TPA: hypothetical protein VFS24_13150 [Steroidobacteraceae bacterium]|nr:hypothetical protein [Steroidobacteraceae bacterium]